MKDHTENISVTILRTHTSTLVEIRLYEMIFKRCQVKVPYYARFGARGQIFD